MSVLRLAVPVGASGFGGGIATPDAHWVGPVLRDNIAASGDNLWVRVCEALGVPELVRNPDYASGGKRSENRKALNERLAQMTRANTSAHWIATLNKAGVPCGPINNLQQVFDDPQHSYTKTLFAATPRSDVNSIRARVEARAAARASA